jgi:hypothetical protein
MPYLGRLTTLFLPVLLVSAFVRYLWDLTH